MAQAQDAAVRTEFETRNPDEARELLDRTYGSRLQVDAVRADGFRVATRQVQAGHALSARVEMQATLRFQNSARDQVTFTRMLAGTSERGEDRQVFGRGDVFVAVVPGLEEPVRTENTRTHVVQLPAALLNQLANTSPDVPADGWHFLSRRPVDGGTARWNGVVETFERLTAEPQRASAPLVIGAAVRLLGATALDVFPNTAFPNVGRTDGRDANVGTVHRAIAFIEANPSLDITLADIARAAYVSTRAVQLAFRRQLDTTPTAYLRQVRLGHARRELQDASPGDGVTVTRVAFRWGFSTPGRFTSAYRAAYGETPRETLDR